MKKDIMFSVIIPTYNRGGFILKSIESYLSQEYSNFEIIIVDDGSTDNTREVVSKVEDKKVAYYYIENSERGVARNYGVSVARGDYINFCDSDDFVYGNHFSEAYDVIAKKKLPVFHQGFNVICGEKIISVQNPSGLLNDRLIKGNILSCSGTFLKKEIALENKFKEDRALAGSEDWLLWLILSSKYDFVGFSEVTSALVQHDGRSMAQMDGDKTLARVTLLQEYLEKTVSFQDKYGTEMPVVCGCVEMLVALDFALEKKKMSSLKYLFRSIAHDRKLILSRRVLAVVKHLILRW